MSWRSFSNIKSCFFFTSCNFTSWYGCHSTDAATLLWMNTWLVSRLRPLTKMLGLIASPHGVPQLLHLSVELLVSPAYLPEAWRGNELIYRKCLNSTWPTETRGKRYKDCFQEGPCPSVISPVCRCIRINSGKASFSKDMCRWILDGFCQITFTPLSDEWDCVRRDSPNHSRSDLLNFCQLEIRGGISQFGKEKTPTSIGFDQNSFGPLA